MKERYQISKTRAWEKFIRWAKDNPVPIQLTFPTSEIVELAEQSFGDLRRSIWARKVGRQRAFH